MPQPIRVDTVAPPPVRRAAPRRPGWRLLLGALPLLALLASQAGCTLHPTPYQALGEAGGYEESQLGERVFRVSFRGNRATPETTVLDFLYLRCAELTRQNGYTHFMLEQDFGRTQTSTRPAPRSSVSVGMGFGGSRSFWGLGMNAPLSQSEYETVVDYHLAVFVVRMLTDAEAKALSASEGAAGGRQVYDAAFLMQSLDAKKQASLRKDG